MLSLFRIANKPEYADSFLQHLREDMEKPGNLISVHSRDIDLAGKFNTSSTKLVQTVNLSNGTVGVKYYNQPTSKDEALRKVPVTDYKDLSSSRIDESGMILPPKQPSKTTAKKHISKYPDLSRSVHSRPIRLTRGLLFAVGPKQFRLRFKLPQAVEREDGLSVIYNLHRRRIKKPFLPKHLRRSLAVLPRQSKRLALSPR
jgi:hypothetical protein